VKAKVLVWLVAAAMLASAGVVCAYDETGTTTTFGEGTTTTRNTESTIVGYAAGNGNSSTGNLNTFIGAYAGMGNTEGNFNTFMGALAGSYNSTGHSNTFIGRYAGHINTTGTTNTSVGTWAGYSNSNGNSNTSIGHEAGYSNSNGSFNTSIGRSAGRSNSSGYSNTFIGQSAGYYNSSGHHNVFLGQAAGLNATGSHKLYIDNCFSGLPCTNPLIYGEFDNRLLKIDGSLGVGTTPVRQLHVAGSNAVFRMDRSVDTASFMLVRIDTEGTPLKTFVVGTNASGANQGEFVINDLGTAVAGPGSRRMTITNNGAVDFTGIVTAPQVIETSSLAFKTNVRTYENALDTVKRLRGVHFDWKESGKPSVGLIAEEVDRVIPEVVSHEGGAAKGVNYASLVGVLVEAVKEQQKELDSLKGEMRQQQGAIAKQQEINAELKAEINRLKSRDMIAQR
jgi:trimeric autotransporter adhesin